MDAARVDGGWQVDARFRFMTGAADARWCTANGLDLDAPEAGMYAFVLPMGDLTVSDNWVGRLGDEGHGVERRVRTGRPRPTRSGWCCWASPHGSTARCSGCRRSWSCGCRAPPW